MPAAEAGSACSTPRRPIVVSLPADATLKVDGITTKATLGLRTFATPVLPAGQNFHYTLTAEIVRDGQNADHDAAGHGSRRADEPGRNAGDGVRPGRGHEVNPRTRRSGGFHPELCLPVVPLSESLRAICPRALFVCRSAL